MKTRERKLSAKEQAAAKKKYGSSETHASKGRKELDRISKPVGGVPGGVDKKAEKVVKAVKSGDPESLVSDNSIAMQIKRKIQARDRQYEKLSPTRQSNGGPQRGPSSQANDQEDYN